MLGFIKKFFLTAMTFFNFNLSNVNSLECASRNNQECKIRTNETRHIKWHKTFATSFRCGCKQLTDKKNGHKGFIWNLSNCECECDKSYDIGEYLDYKNCKCRKKIIDKLTEECSENIYENKILYNETLDIISSSDDKTSDSCIVYIVLFSVFLIINIPMAIYVYSFLYLKNKSTNPDYFGCLNINGY